MNGGPSVHVSPPPGETTDDGDRWAEALPLAPALVLEWVHIEPGQIAMRFADPPISLNPNGSVDGGLLVAAADDWMRPPATKGLPQGARPATASLHVEYHSPAFLPLTLPGQGGPSRPDARVRRGGHRGPPRPGPYTLPRDDGAARRDPEAVTFPVMSHSR
jgi:acyl-coenzyme A thioesterase PaaI-like protein